jgi:hypothetical protein
VCLFLSENNFSTRGIEIMATSVQSMSRVGDELDLYYYDAETSKKQAFPTTQNTKFVQSFANLSGGSSVFTVPPQNGLQDVVCEFQLPALVDSDPAGALAALELPRGWGYALIKQVSYRYGGSSQYFLSGQQVLQNALRKQTSRTSADDILTLGGSYANGAGGAAGNLDVAQSAAIVLTLPHNTPSGVNKAHPLPTDLLTQQVQITVELNPIASIFKASSTAPAGTLAQVPSSLSKAQFQAQQVMLNNQGDALARRVDMSQNAYSFPAEFVQQEVQISLANTAASQSVVLTGFRSGEVKAINCWLSRSSEAVSDPWKWYLPTEAVMTYAGDIYARYELSSSPLWNLINNDKAPAFDTVASVDGGASFSAPVPYLSQWVELPFAQSLVDDDAHAILIHGKPITNGLVNLNITTPSAQSDWVLHVSYIYNTTLLFSQGTADYVF